MIEQGHTASSPARAQSATPSHHCPVLPVSPPASYPKENGVLAKNVELTGQPAQQRKAGVCLGMCSACTQTGVKEVPSGKELLMLRLGVDFPPVPCSRGEKCRTILRGTQEGWSGANLSPRGLPFFTPYWDSTTPACHPSTCSLSSAIKTFEAPCSSIPSTHRPKGYSR